MKFTADLTIKASGKARRFSILAYSGGLLPVDGFDVPVIVDLSGMEVPGSIPILIDHEKSVDATLGITDTISNDGSKLVIGGQVTGTSPRAQQVLATDAAGHKWQASIGARVIEQEEISAGQTVEVNGQVFSGPVIVARRSVLRETSVLPMGADATTQVNLAAKAAATLKGAAPMSFEEWLAELGIDPTTLTPDNLAAMQLAFESKQAPAPEAPAPAVATAPPVVAPTAAAAATIDIKAQLEDLRKQAANESRRIADINTKAAGHPSIIATAIEKGWTSDKVELEVLKASAARTRPTSFTSSENSVSQPKVLEAAFSLARRHKDVEKMYDDKTLQAAHSQFRRGVGLQQMFLMAAASNGMMVAPGTRITQGNVREVLAHACSPQMLQASFSSVSLPGILSNVANKELLDGYMEEDDAWRQIAAVKSVSDFKTVTSYRMTDDMEYEKLGPAGVIKHGKIGEESYTRQADTYAKMFSLTRRDIINDDLGAFDDLRNRVGRGAAKKLNNVFWTAFINNSGFFKTANTNYISGATTNLGTDGVGLGLGVTQFRKMTSPSSDGSKRVNGNGGRPEILLVPPELEANAEILYRNTNLGSVSSSTANIYANKYRPVVAWQLSDSNYTGYSTTAWYLLNNPSYLPAVVVSFLNGQETPTVESADADFNTLGVQFRGYHDFGADQAEYLCGVKSKGAA